MHLTTGSEQERGVFPLNRPRLSWLLLVFTLALVAWLFYERQDELDILWRIPPAMVAALFGLQGLYLIVQGERNRLVLNKCSGQQKIGFLPWLHIFIVGRFLNLFFPQAGNMYRGYELRGRFGVTITSYLTALLSAGWIAASVNFATGALVVLVARPDLQLAGVSIWIPLGGAAVVSGAAPFAGTPAVVRLGANTEKFAWLHGRLVALLQVAITSVKDPRYLCRILIWSLAAFFQAVVVYWACFGAIEVNVGLPEVAAFYAIIQVTTFVAITPGNLGVQELAFGALGAGLGAGLVEGVLVSALLRVTGSAALVAFALPLGGLRLLQSMRNE